MDGNDVVDWFEPDLVHMRVRMENEQIRISEHLFCIEIEEIFVKP